MTVQKLFGEPQGEWFAAGSLLILYYSAQSIYERRRGKQFSFKSVGIQAQGRSTILKINYRNTRQILQAANAIAEAVLRPEERDDDGAPLIQPVSCGRDGQKPLLVRLPARREEPRKIAELLANAHREGHASGDMVILCRHRSQMEACAGELHRVSLPFQVRYRSGDFNPGADTIKVMTMHASKGLEFPVVALAGVGDMPEDGEDEHEEARLFYVAASRATHQLIVPIAGDRAFGAQLMGKA